MRAVLAAGNDKTISVSANVMYEITGIKVDYATGNTTGARQLEVRVQDASNVVHASFLPLNNVSTSSTTYQYQFGVGISEAAVRDSTYLPASLTTIRIGSGQAIRVFDNNVVNTLSDSMNVYITGIKFKSDP